MYICVSVCIIFKKERKKEGKVRSLPIQDVALKTYRERWTIKTGGGRGSRKSVLEARHDDDDLLKNYFPSNFSIPFFFCFQYFSVFFSGFLYFLRSDFFLYIFLYILHYFFYLFSFSPHPRFFFLLFISSFFCYSLLIFF